MISDGSELLLLVPSIKGIIGSVVRMLVFRRIFCTRGCYVGSHNGLLEVSIQVQPLNFAGSSIRFSSFLSSFLTGVLNHAATLKVLPILGAVPDGAMVLFSCLGSNAAEQINVGVGALAGSTIMLITLPWFLSIMAGRVNLRNGQPNYKAKNRLDVDALAGPNPSVFAKISANLFQTGVTAKPVIQTNGKIMMLTSMVYLIIQIPAFVELGSHSGTVLI
jgi:hypothetical protein